MAKRWNRMETWLALIVVAAAMVPVAIMGLHSYMTATAKPLHPDPLTVPSVPRADPVPKWADAAERGRQLTRAHLIEKNLPARISRTRTRLRWRRNRGGLC